MLNKIKQMEYTVYNKNNESINQYIHVQEMSTKATCSSFVCLPWFTVALTEI